MKLLRHKRGSLSGLTLIELVLASALFAFMMITVFQLIESSLSLWRRGEARRSVLEQTTSVAEVLARDLRTLEGGQFGDLLIEWVSFDANKDGVVDSVQPRIRMVRQVTATERALIYELSAVARAEVLSRGGTQVRAEDIAKPDLNEGHALSEVIWSFAPIGSKDSDLNTESVVYRGERLLDDTTTKSFFSPEFLLQSGAIPSGILEEVSSGLLWIDVLCAAQTSVVKEGWNRGGNMTDCATSWDSWRRGRPDVELHDWNQEHNGLPIIDGKPVFPRRVRIEFEFERLRDRRFRARTTEALGVEDVSFEVDIPERIPRGKDVWICIEQEWMKVRSVNGSRIGVERGSRGSAAVSHAPGLMVHHGVRMVREVPIAVYREDWNL